LIPIRFGTAEEFAVVRDFLKESCFQAEEIARRVGVERLHEYRSADPSQAKAGTQDALGVLVRMMFEGAPVNESVVAAHIPESVLRAMKALGLVDSMPNRSDLYGTVRLSAVKSIFLATDRWSNPDGSPYKLADDVVYPGDVKNTLDLLHILPESRCGRLLDIGTGSGVLGLVAAQRYAGEVLACDIAKRSAVFAEFNARLNGLSNVTVGVGDTWEPAGDQTFDRVVCHPPYVPVLNKAWVFYDGGEDGELITRKVLTGAPPRLAPGGRLFCQAMGSDRGEGAWEERVRKFLGDAESEFDVVTVVRELHDPMTFATASVLQQNGTRQDLKKWQHLYSSLKITKLLRCMTILQRRCGPRPVFTMRVELNANTTGRHVEWLLNWLEAAGSGQANVMDVGIRPGPSPRLTVDYVLQDGDWGAMRLTVESDSPFRVSWVVSAWVAHLISRTDGYKTGRMLFKEMVDEGRLPEDATEEEFAGVLVRLVAGGLMSVEGFQPPGPEEA